ncbi:MAG TPA: formylmethanofuran dehydrogenase subunit C [Pirellulales bacterium]|nr:formylmethanofuran dehydrogenase subunit C [Pirellulales bacterium]
MSTLTLTIKDQPAVPLEAETLSPNVLAAKSLDEIRAAPVYVGKRKRRLDELFEVAGEPSEHLELHGNLGRVKWIGRGMTRGRITVHGNAGMHLGAHMKAGEIEVRGDAGDWVGAEMTGGLIRVRGNSGGQIGAAYRGSMAGMRNGTIIVEGTAGLEIGMRMRRGTIVIGGPAKDFVGLQMKGGTIVLLKGAEIRTGAWMMRGTIISLAPIPLLPTFAFDSLQIPVFMNLYAKSLERLGIPVPYLASEGAYECYSGDSSVPGKGEILVWRAAASFGPT